MILRPWLQLLRFRCNLQVLLFIQIVAIVLAFGSFVFHCYVHGDLKPCVRLYNGFSRQATIRWYMCVFVCSACVFVMCMASWIGFAGRPPLVAICVVVCFCLFVLLVLSACVFARFRRKATIHWHMCFFCYVFEAMCPVFLNGFVHMPSFVQISAYNRTS